MDKLQWFKFTPSDWMMGKIQRCPEITQARFMRLCCLYWNKEGSLNVDDSEIEIDQEHLDILISKKIIKVKNDLVFIDFLDEQFNEINESAKEKSKSGIIGNLKRWHPKIYKDFIDKKITLDESVELSKQSLTDRTPITPRSQNIADKDKEEIRQDKDKEYSDEVLTTYHECLKYFPSDLHPKNNKSWLETIDKLQRIDLYSVDEIIKVVKDTRADDFWSKNFLSITKLRKNNNDGVKYFTVFSNQNSSGSKNQTTGTAISTKQTAKDYGFGTQG